jgi:hypothetical protein
LLDKNRSLIGSNVDIKRSWQVSVSLKSTNLAEVEDGKQRPALDLH